LVPCNININFQTKLQTLFEDLGWNKYVTNNVSMNTSVTQIYLKLFLFSIGFKGGSFFYPNIVKIFFLPHLTICDTVILILKIVS